MRDEGHNTGDMPRDAHVPDATEPATAFVLVSREGIVLHAGETFCSMVGRPAADFVGRSAEELAPQTRIEWLVPRYPPTGKSYGYSSDLATAHGPRRVQIELHGIQAGEDELVACLITPTAQREVASDIFRIAIDVATVGVVVYDPDLRIVQINRHVEEMGRISFSHIGMRLQDASPDVSPAIVRAIRHVFATGETVLNLEIGAVTTDGERDFLLNLFPIGPPDGAVG